LAFRNDVLVRITLTESGIGVYLQVASIRSRKTFGDIMGRSAMSHRRRKRLNRRRSQAIRAAKVVQSRNASDTATSSTKKNGKHSNHNTTVQHQPYAMQPICRIAACSSSRLLAPPHFYMSSFLPHATAMHSARACI
jgi:hypothetical protein